MTPSGLLWVACLLAASVLPGRALQYSSPETGHPPDPVQLRDGGILSSNTGSPVGIKAAVWGGADSGEPFSSFIHTSQPEESGNSSISRALVLAAYQLRKQGYNAVYLPFSFSDLQGDVTDSSSGSSSSNQGSSSQPCEQVALPSSGSGAKRSGRVASSTSSNAAWLSKLLQPGDAAEPKGACLSLLPNTTTLDRILWSMQWFLSNGLYVVLSSTSTAADSTRSTAAAAEAWASLWRAVKALPDYEALVKRRVMLQLVHDASSSEQQWEPTNGTRGQQLPGLKQLYLTIMDAVDHVSPGEALSLLQGPQQQQQQQQGSAVPAAQGVWGDGFSAEVQLLSKGLTDPTPFFKALASKPYRDQVVLSPRSYGPQPRNTPSPASSDTVTAPAPEAAGAELTDGPRTQGPAPLKLLDNHYRQLTLKGLCVSEDNCTRFPVAVMQPQQAGHEQQQGPAGTDLRVFADYVLNRQSDRQTSPEDLATGSWYLWDTEAGSADRPPLQQAEGQTGTRSRPPAEYDEPASASLDRRGSIMTFVYAVDSAGSNEGPTFDVQELQPDDS